MSVATKLELSKYVLHVLPLQNGLLFVLLMLYILNLVDRFALKMLQILAAVQGELTTLPDSLIRSRLREGKSK